MLTLPTQLDELKVWRNWVVARLPNKAPLNPNNGSPASSTNPQTWGSYETALACCNADSSLVLGFMFSKTDGFVGIDCDDPNGDAEAVEAQREIFNQIQSYAETSQSGKGLHIICKGELPTAGRKSPKHKIEMYQSERYFIVTGNVYRDLPVNYCNGSLTNAYNNLFPNEPAQQSTQFESQPQTQSDDAVLAMAANAANGESFKQLLAGDWQGKYKSQSEADFAFIDIVAFYTDSMEQVKRIFLASALGERIRTGAKRKHADYIKSMVKKSWDTKQPLAFDPNTFRVTSEVPLPIHVASKSCIKLIRGCDIVEVEQAWLIDEIIPDNTLTGVLGLPGVGKTRFQLGVLAHYSHDYPVLMLTNEDSPSDVRQTFKRLGGNLNNLYVEDSATDEMPWLLDNCEALEEALKEYKPRIIGIDSFYSHAPNKADTNKHDSVAPSLVRLRKLANKYCPILLIHHDNKSNTTDPLKKSGGSQGIVGTVRHNVRVHEHPDDPDVRVVAVFKSNVGKLNVPSLQFTIDPFKWSVERSELTASELLQPTVSADADKARRTKTETAKEFLIAEMADGDRLAREIKERALLWHSIKEDTLDRARKLLGIESHKNTDGVNVWSYAKKH